MGEARGPAEGRYQLSEGTYRELIVKDRTTKFLKAQMRKRPFRSLLPTTASYGTSKATRSKCLLKSLGYYKFVFLRHCTKT